MTRTRKFFKVKVTNTATGRIDYHQRVTRWDIDWLKSVVNLKVEVLEVDNREHDDFEGE